MADVVVLLTATGEGTWTVPDGVTSLRVELVSGGGGGGSADSGRGSLSGRTAGKTTFGAFEVNGGSGGSGATNPSGSSVGGRGGPGGQSISEISTANFLTGNSGSQGPPQGSGVGGRTKLAGAHDLYNYGWGGRGGIHDFFDNSGGGGGGGSGYDFKDLQVTPGENIVYIVGPGGSGSSDSILSRRGTKGRNGVIKITYDSAVIPAFSDNTGDAQSWVRNTAISSIAIPRVAQGAPTPAYTSSGVPAGITVALPTATADGSITGTPTSGVSGTITITATNASGTDTWTVAYNTVLDVSAPVFSDATGDAQTWSTGNTISDVVVPAASGTPTPGYAVRGSLPAGLSFNASTRTISGTPTSIGSGTITIRATNSEGSADWTLAYTITKLLSFPDDPTTIQDWSSGTAISDIVVPVATGSIPPTYAVVGSLPDGIAFNAGTRTLSGTPTTSVNVSTITIRATNTEARDDYSIRYRVKRANPTQTVTLPISEYALQFSIIKNWEHRPLTAVDFDLAPPGDDLWFQGLRVISNGQVDIRFANIETGQSDDHTGDDLSDQFESTGQFILQHGTNVLTLNMADTSDSDEPYTWTGHAAGTAFYRSIPSAGAELTLTMRSVAASPPVFSDATGDALSGLVGEAITDVVVPAASGAPTPTYAVEGSLPAGLAFDTGTRTISGTPTSAGSGTITIRATNSGGVADWTVAYNFAADTTPSAPTLSDQTGVVNTAVDITLPVGTGGNSPLSYSIANLPAGLSFNADTRKITGTPTTEETKTVTYTVTDADGDADSETFTFTIGPEDLTPSAPTLSDQTGVVNTAVDITLPVGTGGNSPLSYAIANLPSGLTFNTSTRKITGTPTTEESKTVTYTVTDADSDADSETFTFTIGPEDLTPSAPTLSDQTGAVNTAVDITLPVGTGGNSPLAYAIANLPSGLTFNTSTRKITGTPTTAETNTVTYTVTDADSDADSETFTFTIGPEDLTPSAPTLSDQTGAVNTAVDITLPVGTGGNSPLAYAIANLPAGLSFNTSTRKITGTPTTAETNTVTYTVTDADSDADSETFTFTISGALGISDWDGARYLSPIVLARLSATISGADITVNPVTEIEGDLVVASDLTVDVVRRHTGGTEIGLGRDGSANFSKYFNSSGSPQYPTAKLFIVINDANNTHIPATIWRAGGSWSVWRIDNRGQASLINAIAAGDQFLLAIAEPDLTPSAPTLSDQAGVVNTAVDITLPVGTGGNSPLAYSIANLPAGLSFNADTRKITGTPTTEESKTVTYTVTDADSDADSETFTFTIGPEDLTPSAPTLSDQTGVVNTAVDITLPVGTGGNSPLAYSIANLPSGLSFNTSTRKITGTPTTEESKTVTYTVTDADSDADSETFTFTISPEDLTPVAPTLSDQTGAVNTAVDITLPVGTGGNSPLTYSIANLPGGLSFNADTRKITGTPTTEETNTVTYTVTDADNDVDSETFTFTINPDLVPSAPTLSDQTGAVSTPLNILLPVGTGGDSPLSYTATNLPSGLSFNASTREITGTPTTPETKTVTYTVTDADGDAVSDTFTFTITDAFRISSWNGTDYLSPIVLARLTATISGVDITVDPVTALEGELVVASDLTVKGVERYVNGTQIRLRKTGSANFNKYFNNSGSPKYRTAKLFIVLNDVGKTHIPFTVANNGGGFSNWNIDTSSQNSLINAIATGDQFLLAIAEPDLTPVLPTVSDQTGIQNTAYTPLLLPVGTSGNGTLTYAIANLPAGLAFDASTRGITGTPTTPQVKIVTYTVTDEDGSADSREFTFTIAADLVPSAPTVADQTGVVRTAVDITLPVGTGGDGALAYAIANLPGGLSFNTGTRKITGTPTTAESKTVTYTVTDADGDADSETFTFTISPEDLTPSAPTLSDQTGVVNTAVDITLPVGTGGDGVLAYAIAGLPAGLSFNTSTRKITGTPTTEETKTVTYTVTDADGDADSETFTFTISPEDLTPSAPTLSDQTGVVNTAVDITLPVGTGGDGDLVYSIANLPAGLSFNTSTRKITGTPTTEETKTVTYTVTDADGDADSETFTFTISPEDLTPSAPTVANQTGAVNTAVDITLPVGTGGDGDLVYSIANLPPD